MAVNWVEMSRGGIDLNVTQGSISMASRNGDRSSGQLAGMNPKAYSLLQG